MLRQTGRGGSDLIHRCVGFLRSFRHMADGFLDHTHTVHCLIGAAADFRHCVALFLNGTGNSRGKKNIARAGVRRGNISILRRVEAAGLGLTLGLRIRSGRQEDGELTAFSGCTGNGQVALVTGHDMFDDGQAQPGAAQFP